MIGTKAWRVIMIGMAAVMNMAAEAGKMVEAEARA
jgi:hypothetical protein